MRQPQTLIDLLLHTGHPVEVVSYNEHGEKIDRRNNHQGFYHHKNYPVRVAVECLRCGVSLLAFRREEEEVSL